MGNFKLSSPWVIFYHKINELFKNDPEVHVEYDEENNIVKLFVDNDEKYDALIKLIPTEKAFGNVTLKIQVVPANIENAESKADLFQKAFKDNPAFKDIISTGDVPGSFKATYILFAREVVQYYSDNLGDPHGYTSTLYQELAKDIFGEIDSTYFCTELETPETGA